MSLNISAYIIYLTLTIVIIVFVGNFFYRNGRIFILSLLKNDILLTDQLNKVLLIAYYLFNIGYAFLKLRFWHKIVSLDTLISSIAENMSTLIFILAITHYFNMVLIWYLSKSKNIHTIKTFQS